MIMIIISSINKYMGHSRSSHTHKSSSVSHVSNPEKSLSITLEQNHSVWHDTLSFPEQRLNSGNEWV